MAIDLSKIASTINQKIGDNRAAIDAKKAQQPTRVVADTVNYAINQAKGQNNSADRGLNNATQTGDTGFYQAPTVQSPSGGGGSYSYGGGGGGYSRGGGGGGGGKSAAQAQKETQAQINNQGDIYGKRAGDLAKNTQQRAKDFTKNTKQRAKDIGNVAKRNLNNIAGQRQANDAALTTNRANIMRNIEWQPNQQKEQSTLMALRNRMGNSAYGSALQDLREGMGRVDDMNDTELINTWKQNEDAAYQNWYQADTSLVADYNEQIAQILDTYSQLSADYADQMSKMQSDYNDELSKLYSNYWTGVSNINPELASKKNMQQATKSAKAKASNASEKKALDTLTKALKSGGIRQVGVNANGTPRYDLVSKDNDVVRAYRSSKVGRDLQKQLGKVLRVTDKNKQSTINSLVKSATKKYDSLLKKAGYKEVSTGKKTDKYTLPNVNLSPKVNFNQANIGPSASLRKKMTTQKNQSSRNQRTASMVRPNHADGNIIGGPAGTYQTATNANSGFSDNLAAFRRL